MYICICIYVCMYKCIYIYMSDLRFFSWVTFTNKADSILSLLVLPVLEEDPSQPSQGDELAPLMKKFKCWEQVGNLGNQYTIQVLAACKLTVYLCGFQFNQHAKVSLECPGFLPVDHLQARYFQSV